MGNIWDSKKFSHLGYKGKDSGHPLYSMYRRMIEAVNLVSDKSYRINKARGVGICDRWAGSFPLFVLDMGNRPSANHYMKRHSRHRSYNKTNCYWAKRIDKQIDVHVPKKSTGSGVPSMFI